MDAASPEPKLNKSTVTITTDLHEDTNSSSSSVTQVTVVTTHPPVLLPPMDKPPSGTSVASPTVTVTSAVDKGSEVIIVANETNKTQINESTDDDPYQLLDSLEYSSQPQDRPISIIKGKKLDESEVLIVSPSFVSVDDGDGYV